MFGFSRGDEPEKPPAKYASGPTISGHTQVEAAATKAVVDAACRQWLGPPTGPKGWTYGGCYVPALDAVFYRQGDQATLDHEMAHARGWNHTASGTGTSDVPLSHVFSPQAPALSDAQRAYLAKALNPSPASALSPEPPRGLLSLGQPGAPR